MSAALDAFVAALQAHGLRHDRLKPDGSGMWCCPSHEDRNPSLSVRAGGDGRVLLNCFAGCETQHVLDAVGKVWQDLFETNGDGELRDRRAFMPKEVLQAEVRERIRHDPALRPQYAAVWGENWLPVGEPKAAEPESTEDAQADGDRPADARAASRPVLISLADVDVDETVWVDRATLALGKLTVFDGNPDVGKSTITADWAARASTGAPFPRGPGFGRPVGVLFIAATEDALGDTILPRVIAAGGDPKRIYQLKHMEEADGSVRPFELPRDLPFILEKVRELDIQLIIIDALMAVLPGKVDSHKTQDVTAALYPLVELARETRAAVPFLRHVTKGATGPAMFHGGGSVGIIGTARVGIVALRDPEDETGAKRLLAVSKCNGLHDDEKRTIAFRLLTARVDAPKVRRGYVEVGRVEWGAEDERRADALVNHGSERRKVRNRAQEFLQRELADGPRPQEELKAEAEGEDISWATLRRAKKELGIEARLVGFQGKWHWWLPGTPETREPEALTPVEQLCDPGEGEQLRESPAQDGDIHPPDGPQSLTGSELSTSEDEDRWERLAAEPPEESP